MIIAEIVILASTELTIIKIDVKIVLLENLQMVLNLHHVKTAREIEVIMRIGKGCAQIVWKGNIQMWEKHADIARQVNIAQVTWSVVRVVRTENKSTVHKVAVMIVKPANLLHLTMFVRIVLGDRTHLQGRQTALNVLLVNMVQIGERRRRVRVGIVHMANSNLIKANQIVMIVPWVKILTMKEVHL